MPATALWRESWRREIKQEQSYVPARGLTNIFSLPGPECHDIQFWLDRGIANKYTTQMFVAERDLDSYAQLKAKLPTFGFTHAPVLSTDIARLPLRAYGADIGLAYLDLCGSLTAENCRWIREELSPCMKPGAWFAITLLRNRTPGWVTECHGVLAQHNYISRMQLYTGLQCSAASMLLLSLVQLCFADRAIELEYAKEYSEGGPNAMLALRYRMIEGRPQPITSKLRTAFDRLILLS